MNRTFTWRPRDDWYRTVVKTLSYRVVMFLITALVVFTITGNPRDAVNIGIATNLIKTLTYFGYERTWSRIRWGTAE